MLSDARSDFLTSFASLAKALADDAHIYSSPDNSIRYGDEIDALRRACLKVADDPLDVQAGGELLRLAESIRRYYDTAPDQPELSEREAEMLALVKLLREGVTDKADVTTELVERLGRDDEEGEKAAKEAKSILDRLKKPAYDAAVKIIGDIESATVRRFLGI